MKKKYFSNLFQTDFLARLDSHYGRKIILSALIILAFSFDLLIWNYGKIISREATSFKPKNYQENPLEKNILSLTSKYPIKKMAPYISQKRKKVAAFMVGVAKQESDWGKRAPVLNGQDCFNYWGYRGKSPLMTHDGYTCFKNPQQAVDIVSARFSHLIYQSNLDTPKKMIVWKCGWNCASHDAKNVSNWINNVAFYYNKFYE